MLVNLYFVTKMRTAPVYCSVIRRAYLYRTNSNGNRRLRCGYCNIYLTTSNMRRFRFIYVNGIRKRWTRAPGIIIMSARWKYSALLLLQMGSWYSPNRDSLCLLSFSIFLCNWFYQHSWRRIGGLRNRKYRTLFSM